MIEYGREGWHAHSGAHGKKRTWWVACYRDGKRVDYLKTAHGHVIGFARYETAQKRADNLNRRDGFS